MDDASTSGRNATTMVQLFLAPGAEPGLDRATARWVERAAAPSDVDIALGRRIADPVLDLFRTRGFARDESIVVYVELSCDRPDPGPCIEVIKGVADALRGTVDIERSRVGAGRVFVVRDGGGPTVLMHWLRKRHDLTRAAFFDYWGGGHTAHSGGLPGSLGYRQHHVDAVWSANAARAAGLPAADFEGVAITNSLDPAAYARHMTNSTASKGMSDNDNFVDVACSPYLTLWDVNCVRAR